MSRRVVISGLGPVSGLGLGIEPTWQALTAGQCAIGAVEAFDAADFDCPIAAEVRDFKVSQFVPKSYRKATKVMARDIELAVAAADLAARDAGLVTSGTAVADGDEQPSYDSTRLGAHIGAGLIAAQLDELTAALVEGRDGDGQFDIHQWGREGINHLTPLWLLKYLPNMLACHVTIIHDAQGPSNTITCAEASSGLSLGESLRVIRRGAADMCFCGGTESKINPMGLLRQTMTGRLNTTDHDPPQRAVRPYCQTAAGSAVGEGGAIVVLEALDTFEARPDGDKAAYAEVAGFGASQTVHTASRNMLSDAAGDGVALAIEAALRDGGIEPSQIDLIVPYGLGLAASDAADAAGLRRIFGDRLADIPIVSPKAAAGNCGAGAGAIDLCVTAAAVKHQSLPAVINCDQPLPGLAAATCPTRPHNINFALTYSASQGGQNAAVILKRINEHS